MIELPVGSPREVGASLPWPRVWEPEPEGGKASARAGREGCDGCPGPAVRSAPLTGSRPPLRGARRAWMKEALCETEGRKWQSGEQL